MQTFERSCFYRRWTAIGVLVWCGVLVTFLAVFGKPDNLREAIATGALLLMGSVTGAYIFGAAWDDRNRDRAVTQATQPPGDTVVIVPPPADPGRPE